ncbi:MAG: DUF3576 domain-containing protein [Alphaproteobacteria bacterium]|nr:DUF3576 domain-containing protein [Alphaproteobacteria bacterium]
MAAGGIRRVLICAGAILALAACSSDPDPGESYRRSPDAPAAPSSGGGLNLFSSSEQSTESAISVNAFLWRASLDTLSFMPLASADPFGGVIITDWYAPPESPNERFKMNVYILGRALRADGLKISVFRQTQDGAGRWADAAVGQEVATEVENAVLTRARELRLQSVAEEPNS